jgi:hypothetical protein
MRVRRRVKHTGRAKVVRVLVGADLRIEGFDCGGHYCGLAGVMRLWREEVWPCGGKLVESQCEMRMFDAK